MAFHRWRKVLSFTHFPCNRNLSFSSSSLDCPIPITTRRVVVTGLGLVTPLGCGVEAAWKRLIKGKCGIRAITLDDLKMDSFDEGAKVAAFEQLTSRVAGIVPCGSNPGEFDEQIWLNPKEHRSITRFIAYALCAADEALRDANWAPTEQEDKEMTGVSVGGGTGSISDVLEAAQMICEKRLRRLSPFFIPRILINMASGHISMKYGFQGPNHAAVTACATGAHSIGDAARMIQCGDADVMVAGGTESSIDALSIAGFCRSRAMTTKYNSSPKEASRPFDCGRDGFVIGEGSGVLVLEELEHARKRGAKIYAEFRGYGMSGDAYHITQPHSDGKGAILAMERALKQSNLHPSQVDYVNAHAISMPLGDAVDAKAIKEIFSGHASSGALALSSTKGAVGRLLGAAGAVEVIFSMLAIHKGVAPLTLNLTNLYPVFNDGLMPLSTSKEMPVRAALSNSFGFGGTNTSLRFISPQKAGSGIVCSLEIKGMEVGITVGLETREGSLKLTLLDVGCHVRDISIELDGGASWLYQGMVDAFEMKIRSLVESAITEKLKEVISKLDLLFQSIPKELHIGGDVSLNVTIVNDPQLSSSSIGFQVNGLFMSRNGVPVPDFYERKPYLAVTCRDPDKMLGISLDEAVFLSASSLYYNAKFMHWIVDKIPDQSLLNTAGWKFVIPQLYKQYPNDDMNLNISLSSPPDIQISENNVGASVYADLVINVVESGEVVSVACISLVIRGSGTIKVVGNNLAGRVKLRDFTMSMKWSNIGNLRLFLIQPVMWTIIETVFLPYTNAHLGKGYPLPLIHGFTLQNAEVICSDSQLTVCGDVSYSKFSILKRLVMPLFRSSNRFTGWAI